MARRNSSPLMSPKLPLLSGVAMFAEAVRSQK
jgi:hypothetical protein